MSLRPYKFIVQAIVQEVEGDVVVDEKTAEPVTLFGCEAVAQWAQEFKAKLAEVESERS